MIDGHQDRICQQGTSTGSPQTNWVLVRGRLVPGPAEPRWEGRGRAEVFRTLVDYVMLVPDACELTIVLRGDLAAILRFAAGKKKPDLLSEVGALDGLLSQA